MKEQKQENTPKFTKPSTSAGNPMAASPNPHEQVEKAQFEKMQRQGAALTASGSIPRLGGW